MYVLSSLPYSYGSLEPYIEGKIMELHHAKHQQAYVDGLNASLSLYPEFFQKPLLDLLKNLEALPLEIKTAVRNHGGGVENHTFFWNIMGNHGDLKMGGQSVGKVHDEIIRTFDSFEAFKKLFSDAARTCFGSGWAWLVIDNQGRLKIMTTSNQDSPISQGLSPILGLDVWEHAYYLQYFNRRVDYISSWWHVVNWHIVENMYEAVLLKQ